MPTDKLTKNYLHSLVAHKGPADLGGFLACPNVLREASLISFSQSCLTMAIGHGQWPW